MKAFLKELLSSPVVPLLVLYRWGCLEFTVGGQWLALIPGGVGRLWRRAWYRRTLEACGENLAVDWMAAIRSPRTRVGNDVYIGVFSWIGWADIGNDVLLGGHVRILSGAKHHGFDRTDIPIARQKGDPRRVSIGSDVWIGNGAVVMADIADGSVIGAGAVVTRSHPSNVVLAGVPARVLRRRGDGERPTA